EEPQSGGEIRGTVRFQGRFVSSRSHGNRREQGVFRGKRRAEQTALAIALGGKKKPTDGRFFGGASVLI
ncbi:MAG TPA: hypothetical protein DCX29_08540, partial [Hyphomonas sp.]|nr:hypothetical protein [Hyphomonas sp.]